MYRIACEIADEAFFDARTPSTLGDQFEVAGVLYYSSEYPYVRCNTSLWYPLGLTNMYDHMLDEPPTESRH